MSSVSLVKGEIDMVQALGCNLIDEILVYMFFFSGGWRR